MDIKDVEINAIFETSSKERFKMLKKTKTKITFCNIKTPEVEHNQFFNNNYNCLVKIILKTEK